MKLCYCNLIIASAALLNHVNAKKGDDDDSVKRLEPDYSLEVDDDCMYTLQVSMKHDDTLPTVTDGSWCDPSVVPPTLAEDGLPYFATRYYPFILPKEVPKITGFYTVSMDYNACGHPPVGVFTIPHYDFHSYIIDEDFRSAMTCDMDPSGAPVCDYPDNPVGNTPYQTTASGRGMFVVSQYLGEDVANMPANFTCSWPDALPNMGLHCFDFDAVTNQDDWTEPTLIMGSYDGDIAFYEPMVPLSFMTGDVDKEYSQTGIEYMGHTKYSLPRDYSVSYSAETFRTTISFTGPALQCNKGKQKKGKGRRLRK